MMANGVNMQHQRIWPILIGANNAYLISIFIFTLGLTQLLQQNALILKVVQEIGIIYLLYLAYAQWNKKIVQASTLKISKKSSLYVKGALIALSNPKTITLFGLIFPQFITDENHRLLQVVILGVTFLVLQFSSGYFYAYFGGHVKNLLEKSLYQNLINKVSSVILVAISVFLLLAKL